MDEWDEARSRRWPPLPAELARQLESIPASADLYRPCEAILRDGTRLPRVYFAEAARWYALWGVWPDEDRGKVSLDVRTVAAVRESPNRIPPEFAARLYEAGESGMGYLLFQVEFRDGSSASYLSGGAVDFIDFPDGQSPTTIVGVIPHAGRNSPALRHPPDYYWCLYSADPQVDDARSQG